MDATGDGKITISDFEKMFEDEEQLCLGIACFTDAVGTAGLVGVTVIAVLWVRSW